MTPGTKERIRSFMKSVLDDCEFVKTLDVDQFTIMRVALIRSLAETVYRHLEV